MKGPDKVLKELIMTKKSVLMSSNLNQYVFKVYKDINKKQIEEAITKVFKCKIVSIKILNKSKRKKMRNGQKYGYISSIKKAYVKIEKINK